MARPDPQTAAHVQYAVNPLAILVVAWHGQVEPVALTCILVALLVLRSRRYGVAGASAGIGGGHQDVADPAFLRAAAGHARRQWPVALGALVAVPLAFFLTMPLVSDAKLGKDLGILSGYRSYVGIGGWTGVVRMHTNWTYLGYSGPTQSTEQHIGVGLLAVGLLFVIWVWRRAEPEILMLATLLMFGSRSRPASRSNI